jgi:Gluconate 2-dehydrogenase subunit 3
VTTPGSTGSRFPGFDVTAQARTWDRVTASVVLGRLVAPRTLVFFTAEEEPTARALVDRLLAQDDEPRVPVIETIAERLVRKEGDGFRYADMPEDDEAWRRSISGLDADARRRHGRPFWDLDRVDQKALLQEIQDGKGCWQGMPAARVFSLWTRYACDAFYSHPWAWNEIGFGGPAYPRGYKNLGHSGREPWEVADNSDLDPVPWAERAEAARRRHERGRN